MTSAEATDRDGVQPLSAVATGRSHSLFAADLAAAEPGMRALVEGRRVLCIGAAGSIGSSTARLAARYRPAALHIIDQNENELAEFVRSFRSLPWSAEIADFRTLPLDYGSPVMGHFLRAEARYDLVLNFAAIKHVRSEKDAFSVLQMFDTNLLKQARLLAWLAERDFAGRYFSVSTDKAANPTSMMGATKRVMEHVMFSQAQSLPLATITSARFANVAFSNGSLLKSFEQRLARGEPLAAPRETKRYFVSLEESGEICLLAATAPPHGSIVIPRLDPRQHLIELRCVAEAFLARSGYAAAIYEDEDSARQNVAADIARGRWPLLLTPLDTSGEKAYEEFVGEDEVAAEIGFAGLLAVAYRPSPHGSVTDLIARLERALHGGNPACLNKDELKEMIAGIEPRFLETHRETGRNLDQRM